MHQAGFVELPAQGKAPIPAPDFDTQLIIKTAGVELRVNEDTPTELVTRILGVICHAE